MAEKFDNLEEHLEKFVENIRQLGIIVSDFQPSSQTGLNQKLNFMITGLQDIEKCRQQINDINVPLEVFEYIDQGRNPQLYTKECLERALAKNEQVKGKIDTLTMNVVPSGVWKFLPRMNQTCGGPQLLFFFFLRSWLISFDFPMMSSKEALSLKVGLKIHHRYTSNSVHHLSEANWLIV
ncbi:mediator of RNA polymerase II transcription subunit 10-like isoform X1 [Myxocyprinus asiaticus]|uniref:mediator of RNA polymerase II transcription subunit 10-like isoform X1 n=1 Tax=Myxocyprinus asiaticus TaxID=70543 RepID=UPI0022212B6B|nr:mediator of RNA polymerase II transcription subunit 10-like isoform X1 [Myxocyprinus asiaticus]